MCRREGAPTPVSASRSEGNVVQAGLLGLGVLVLAGDVVFAAIFYQVGAGLVEDERHMCLAALAVHVEHPAVIQRTGIFARLASHRHFLHERRVEIPAQIYAAEQRGGDDQAVL